ncbi:hypothetical protein SK128_004750, partial [Halocaridina rubra]
MARMKLIMNTIFEDEDNVTQVASTMGEREQTEYPGRKGCCQDVLQPGFTEGLITRGFQLENENIIHATSSKRRQKISTVTYPENHPSGCYRTGKGSTEVRKRKISYILNSKNTNNTFWGLTWPLPRRTLWVCCLWVLITTPTNTCADSNGCDFYG